MAEWKIEEASSSMAAHAYRSNSGGKRPAGEARLEER